MPAIQNQSPVAKFIRRLAAVAVAALTTLTGYACGSLALDGWNDSGPWYRGALHLIFPLVAFLLLAAATARIAWQRGAAVGNGVLALGTVCILCCIGPFAVLTDSLDLPISIRIWCAALLVAEILNAARFTRRYLRGDGGAVGYGMLAIIGTFLAGLVILAIIVSKEPWPVSEAVR